LADWSNVIVTADVAAQEHEASEVRYRADGKIVDTAVQGDGSI
jgi:hypothetical protein